MTWLALAAIVTSAHAETPEGCVRLKVGQAAVIRSTIDDSPTSVGSGYGLSHPKDDTYLAEVRLGFAVGEGYDGGLPPAEVPAKARTHVDNCLRAFEGTIRNERAGKNLILRLTDNPSVPLHVIKVVASGKRANSGAYPWNLACAAVLHEVLHLLGLPDEYPDKPGLTEQLADCRATSADDSIMNDESGAADRLKPKAAYSVEMCRCAKRGFECWELGAKADGKSCPPGTTSFLQPVEAGIKTSLNAMNTPDAFVLNEKRIETGTETPRTSVLYPAHFRAITEPGCTDVNSAYYGCVRNAYRSSKDDASGRLDKGCLPMPEACKWRSRKWLE